MFCLVLHLLVASNDEFTLGYIYGQWSIGMWRRDEQNFIYATSSEYLWSVKHYHCFVWSYEQLKVLGIF